MKKVDIKIVGRPSNMTFDIEGNYLDVVSALSQALVEVAKMRPEGKELVSNACTVIIDKIND